MPAPDGIYFDAKTTARREVSLDFAEEALVLEEDGKEVARWAYADIRKEDAGPDDEGIRITSIRAPESTGVEVSDKYLIAEIEERCTQLLAGKSRGRFDRRHVVLAAVAAVLLLVVIALWLMPYAAASLTRLVPRSIEQRVGDAVYRQVLTIFGAETTCASGGKDAAPVRSLETLADKLRGANGLDAGDLTLMVIKSDVPNVFALPRGRIVILDGILQAAETPDEVTAVLAHETSHVVHHDPLRTVIESGGLGFVLGAALGDSAGAIPIYSAGKALVQASSSREAEAVADAYAIETMRVLGRSPVALGNLLTRLTPSQGGALPSLVDSHPATPERLAAMKSARVLTTGLPILNEFEFKALKHICDD